MLFMWTFVCLPSKKLPVCRKTIWIWPVVATPGALLSYFTTEMNPVASCIKFHYMGVIKAQADWYTVQAQCWRYKGIKSRRQAVHLFPSTSPRPSPCTRPWWVFLFPSITGKFTALTDQPCELQLICIGSDLFLFWHHLYYFYCKLQRAPSNLAGPAEC